VTVLVVALAIFGRSQPISFVFARTPAVEGSAYGVLFCISLLQAMWTFTGYDASAHVSEETRDPSRSAPWGLLLSVAVSGVFGYLLVCGLALAIRPGELGAIAADETAPLAIVRHALGDGAGRGVMALAVVAMWL